MLQYLHVGLPEKVQGQGTAAHTLGVPPEASVKLAKLYGTHIWSEWSAAVCAQGCPTWKRVRDGRALRCRHTMAPPKPCSEGRQLKQ